MGATIGTGHRSVFWINLEPCGLFCGSMSWFLLAYGMFATTRYVIFPWLGFSLFGIFNMVAFNAISIIAIYSHMKAMTTDPGSVPLNAVPLEDDQQEIDYQQYLMAEGNLSNSKDSSNEDSSKPNRVNKYKKFCRRCKAFKPMRAHHCSICGRCIVKMDHHCPWVNNCVGVGNHKLFLLFVFWVMVASFYCITLVLSRYFTCIVSHQRHCFSQSANLYIIFLMIESVLFGLFTLCMLGDQLSSISANQTQIDRLKKTKYKYQTEVNEVCGTPSHIKFQYSWLLPTPAKFPIGGIFDKIMGFRVLRGDTEGEEMSPLIRAPSEEIQIKADNDTGDIATGNDSKENNTIDDANSFTEVDKADRSSASSNRSFYTEEEIDEEALLNNDRNATRPVTRGISSTELENRLRDNAADNAQSAIEMPVKGSAVVTASVLGPTPRRSKKVSTILDSRDITVNSPTLS